jgi:hypothetical protein
MKSLPSQLTKEALDYTSRQIAERAGIIIQHPSGNGFEQLGLPFHYADPEDTLLNQPSIIVTPCKENDWVKSLESAPNGIDWIPPESYLPTNDRSIFDEPIPVLFWGTGRDNDLKFAELRSDGNLVINVDIIASAFFMLTRLEEPASSIQDDHGRFPASASLAFKQNFLDRPIIDEYGLILREWLKVALPGWKPNPRTFSVKISHDIDLIRYYRTNKATLRSIGGDLFKRRILKQAWQKMVAMIKPWSDPYYTAIPSLAKISQESGLGNDAFYFMMSHPSPMENDYDPQSPLITSCIKTLREQGFEIGLHAGYRTFCDPKQLSIEKERMDSILGKSNYGGRQHYLRFKVPTTLRNCEQVGLAYDSSMGYADHEGFRCGTCYSFRPFDVEQNREMKIKEVPLIVMDQTLRRYRKLSPNQAEERIMQLAKRSKRVGGTFTLLWHNSSLVGEWQTWEGTYRRVVKGLANMVQSA